MSDTAGKSSDQWLGHPRGLFVLFFTELWERFSFYGMKALLILYLTKHFLFGDQQASIIYGSYASLVYAMPVLGGLIADRYLGLRKAITIGAILLVFGHFGMAFEGDPARYVADGEIQRSFAHTQIFYFSLALIIVGVGFLKPNISTLVGRLYGSEDPRRDSGFTIFYMGINLGSLVSTLACAYLGETYGWRYGFGLAGIGMLVGLISFLRGREHLKGCGEAAEPELLGQLVVPGFSRERVIYIATGAAILSAWLLMQYTGELGFALSVFGILVVGYVIWYSLSECEPLERDRMLVMLILMGISVLFWALFEQAGSSITLFTDRNVAMGDLFTAGMFQSINPFFIILLAPLFAWLWVGLARAGYEPSIPAKFALAVIQAGLGFAILVLGASLAGDDARVSVIWLVLMYLFHTTGELCLSPVGLSMVTKLSVPRIAAMMMGVWFLSSSFAAYAAGLIAATTSISEPGQAPIDDVASLARYSEVFGQLALTAIVLGVLILALAPLLNRWMHGVR